MIPNNLKAVILLASLSALFLLMGQLIGGSSGLHVAFIMALCMNFIAYFFSENIILTLYRAKKLDEVAYRYVYDSVAELSTRMKIPMPKLWIVSMPIANAFATGRNPNHASVVLTREILDILTPEELRGVLAHELSHIKNRDILVTSIAATLATAIGYLANMMQYAALFGASSYNNDSQKRTNPIIMVIVAMIMPLAATLLQLALSRSREYYADESGATYSHSPLALAAALAKINNYKKYTPSDTPVEATTSSLFIINPLTSSAWATLFSTHPPVEKRIKRLQEMAHKKF